MPYNCEALSHNETLYQTFLEIPSENQQNGHFVFFDSLWGGLEAGYGVHLRLIEKPVVDFLLVIIELFSLAVMLVELWANIDWKAPF